MGKGTALKRKSDLDFILVMNDVRDASELARKYEGILAQIVTLLTNDPLKESGWRITIINHNEWLVQIEMTDFHKNETVEVDIFPTFDADVYDGKSLTRETLPY